MVYDNRSDIIALVELDQRIAQLSQEEHELEEKRMQLEQELEEVNQDLADAEKNVHNLTIKIDGLELELTSLAQKKERIKEKLLSVGSQKELDSLHHEEESLQAAREKLDEEGLALLLEREQAYKETAFKKIELPKKMQVMHTELDEVIDRHAHVKKLKAAYLEDRVDLVKQAPDDFLEVYDSMRQKIGNPVVPVINEACSVCGASLRSSELAKLKAGEFIPCQGCYRLLYLFNLEHENE